MSFQTKLNAVTKAYGEYLKAGTKYGEAMREAIEALGDTPCITLLEPLAKVHAAKYGCNYTCNGESFVFHDTDESTRETRRGDAFQSWRRNVMVWFAKPEAAQPTKSQRISKAHRDAAQAYLAQFESVKDAIAVLRAIAK